MLDFVEKGQVLGRIDEGPLLLELAALQVELKQLEAEIPSTIESERMDKIDREMQLQGQRIDLDSERRRIAERIEQLRLEEAQQQAAALVFRVTFEVQDEKVRRLDELSKDKLLDLRGSMEIFDAKSERDAAKQGMDGAAQVIREIAAQRQELTSQLAASHDVGKAPEVDLEALLKPHRAAIAAHEHQIELLSQRLENLSIVAPVSGTVMTIWARPGQSVPLGAPIATIAAHSSDYIVSYIHQELPLQPTVGMEVDVLPRRQRRENFVSRVERVGPQVELVPEHQRSLHEVNKWEWGLPVWIRVPEEGEFRPGELVDLRFHAQRK